MSKEKKPKERIYRLTMAFDITTDKKYEDITGNEFRKGAIEALLTTWDEDDLLTGNLAPYIDCYFEMDLEKYKKLDAE